MGDFLGLLKAPRDLPTPARDHREVSNVVWVIFSPCLKRVLSTGAAGGDVVSDDVRECVVTRSENM